MKHYLALVLFGAAISMAASADDSDDIVQICDSQKDLSCLRSYFKDNAEGGSVVEDATEVPYYEVNLPIYVPFINLTAVCIKDYLGNLNGDIEEAYMDKETGNLVLSVNFKGLFIHAPDTIFALGRDAKEPKIIQEYVNCTYPTTLTAVIHAPNGLSSDSLKNAQYSAYFENSNADIVLGPKFTESDDPEVLTLLDELLADIPTALEEIFLTKASYYFICYIQNYIYDFKMSPVLYDIDMTVFNRVNKVDSDDDSKIKKICDDSDDKTKCARDFFGENSSGSVVSDPSDDAVPRKMFASFVPYLNASVITMDAEISNLNGEIESILINEATNNLVMNVVFEGIVISSPETKIILNQKGAQPKVITDKSEIKYPVSLTAVIPMGDDGITAKSIKMTYVSQRLSQSNAAITLGSSIDDSDDPQAKTIAEEVKNNPNDIAVELLITEAYDLFLAYLQKYICDFNEPISA